MQRAENFSLRLFVALLIVSGLLWGLDKLGWAKPIKAMLEFGVAPFRSGFADAGAGAAQLVTPLKYSFGGARKVADLERQVAALSVDASKAVLLAQENEALRKIVGANKRGEKQLEPFRVIGRGEEWIISGGKQQGVQTGQVVVSSEGAMVGVVVEQQQPGKKMKKKIG